MTSPTTSSGRAGKIVAIGAGLALVAVCVTVGVLGAASTAPSADRSPEPEASVATPIATPEQAYQLSLPALDAWLADDFANSWIVASATLAQVGRSLDAGASDDTTYAVWVGRFESMVTVADAIHEGDEAAARAAFDPLLAEEPGPYVDATIDHALPREPISDAFAAIDQLDAAIVAEDRTAARQAAADTALALAQLGRASQVDLSAETGPQAFGQMLPALHAIDDIQDAVLHGHAADAAQAAATLRATFADFHAWYVTNHTNENR